MLAKCTALLPALLVFALPPATAADGPPLRAADVPREFKGTYEWRDEQVRYTVTLKIDRVTEKDGVIRFSGTNLYTPGDLKTKIEGTIDARSRRLTLRESEPSQPEGADTDGAFVGTISEDRQAIRAVWTSKASGNKGDLELKAKK
jgi:hypothetical protein